MSGRARRFRFALLAALLVASAASSTSAAQAVPDPETGVWWQVQTPDGQLPPPPTLPAGGLWLQSSPTGDSAVSALRFAVPETTLPVSLQLNIAADQSVPPVSALDLCASKNAWEAPAQSPGHFADRAVADCESMRIPGKRSPDGNRVEFDLNAVTRSNLDLVLARPHDDATSLIDIYFEQPRGFDVDVKPAVTGGGFIRPPDDDVQATSRAGPTGDQGQDSDSGPTWPAVAPPAEAGGLLRLPTGPEQLSVQAPTAPPVTADGPQGPSALAQPPSPDRAGIRGRDAAHDVALLLFAGLALWIAVILSRMRGAGSWRRPGYTLYRGTPPDRP